MISNGSESTFRSFTQMSIYDTAQGLYSVLVGLVLTDTLKEVALDINRSPLHGDWNLRFLTASMLVLAGVWLHVYLATFRLHSIDIGRTGRHQTQPGISYQRGIGYFSGLLHFWLGIGQLVVIACMAYAIPDQRKFFTGAIVYAATIVAFETSFFKASAARLILRPRKLIIKLRESRHLPVTDDDLSAHASKQSPALSDLLAQTAVYEIIMAFVLILVSVASLVLATYEPTMSVWVAMISFIAICVVVALDYVLFPQFYSL